LVRFGQNQNLASPKSFELMAMNKILLQQNLSMLKSLKQVCF